MSTQPARVSIAAFFLSCWELVILRAGSSTLTRLAKKTLAVLSRKEAGEVLKTRKTLAYSGVFFVREALGEAFDGGFGVASMRSSLMLRLSS